MTGVRLPAFEALQEGRKEAVARVLAAIETHADDPAVIALLDRAWSGARGHVTGITGPPGVGKSSLINALVSLWRKSGRSVGVIAVDPSSRASGGALLGDRTRITADPEDTDVFVRSMAARDRLGGLADLTFAAMTVMRAVYDIVIVETVGVGQSETEITDLADTVIFCVQPGSGDALQFMKAGIVEIPHLAVVTKADMGLAAERARSDLEGAIGLVARPEDGWEIRVMTVSTQQHKGLAEVLAAIDAHGAWLDQAGNRGRRRQSQAVSYFRSAIRDRFGREGLARSERIMAQDVQREALISKPFSATQAQARKLLDLWAEDKGA